MAKTGTKRHFLPYRHYFPWISRPNAIRLPPYFSGFAGFLARERLQISFPFLRRRPSGPALLRQRRASMSKPLSSANRGLFRIFLSPRTMSNGGVYLQRDNSTPPRSLGVREGSGGWRGGNPWALMGSLHHLSPARRFLRLAKQPDSQAGGADDGGI